MSAFIEGRHVVAEALRSGVPLQRVLVARGQRTSDILAEIRERAAAAGIPVSEVDRSVLDRQSERGRHQGVAAVAEEYRYAELGDLLRSTEGCERSLLLVLDHVTDPMNLGAVARTAEVVGADGLVVPKDRAAGVGPAAHKAAAGAFAHLPVARVANLPRALEACKDAGFWVVGASEHADATLWDAPVEGRLVVVLGAEGSGLGRLVRERCDLLVAIPTVGKVSSLNVAQAATVLAFEWARRGREPGGSVR